MVYPNLQHSNPFMGGDSRRPAWSNGNRGQQSRAREASIHSYRAVTDHTGESAEGFVPPFHQDGPGVTRKILDFHIHVVEFWCFLNEQSNNCIAMTLVNMATVTEITNWKSTGNTKKKTNKKRKDRKNVGGSPCT